MSLMETMFKRKCVRSYTGELPTEEELQLILQVANSSPVGRALYENMHLTVITNPEILGKITTNCANFFGNPAANPLYGAPMLILVSIKAPDAAAANSSFSNAAIMAHNMILAATDLGLGAVHIWGAIGALGQAPDLVAELGLPEGFIPACAAAIGKTDVVYEEREIPIDRISMNVLK